MENKEWAGEEMSLQRFSKETPFAVPAGYFEEAGQRILSLVNIEGLKTDDTAQGFAVPADYFENLTNNIQSRINIEAAADPNEPSFAVPQGYFDQLSANIQSRIAIEDAANKEDIGFTVPAGYFDNLQQQINSRIAVEILQKEPVFEVPENYFETLNKNILAKTTGVGREEVIRKTIVRKLWASNTFKYATAACLALIIGAGAFLRNAQVPQPVEHQRSYLHSQLSQIPADEIKDYLELHIDASDNRQLLENANEEQINTDALSQDLQDYLDVN
ncbi:hypothetical protein FPZ42_01360 [Mucilaginibacter achroorhodeus]|uniref:Uncharacterized protein n=2 Tax=Mucilaginibacter TaxID=423349 RepID=A0A563U976_9SPHI|nr:hypothetical protein [Mucilaginibacter achroorhodeus]QXV67143.1 hypothetical protein INP83_08685 [Mucilaginibacter sp. 21P]TWR27890.1 hypothetical protein FPZ42_01360 [Mucilaginibacter achroorhodeus]